ncbi:MAG: viperin family antiviral radical SAM protein [Polyangiaceae bacterium]
MTTCPESKLPPSVNYHLWQPCNMRCHHCFATFEDVKKSGLPRGHLPRQQAQSIVALLAERFEKLTFAGGEPTLCPWLFDLMDIAKRRGTVTMLVTNGSLIDEPWLDRFAKNLDWLTLSIDSADAATNVRMGRSVSGQALSPEAYAAMAKGARERGIRLKVNTVLTRHNAGEDMRPLIAEIAPERWKVLQALPVIGQNDEGFADLACDDGAFHRFVDRHLSLNEAGIAVVPEDNHAMRGSYAMVDPGGRFFDNVDGAHHYSRPILDVGVDGAWKGIRFSMALFDDRGGRYEFGKDGRKLPIVGG